MEQIGIFFTEEANWIVMGLCAFTVLLLLITLRRVRRIEKKTKEIAGNTERLAAQMEELLAVKDVKENHEKAQETLQKSVSGENPGDIIDAVLGEVFP